MSIESLYHPTGFLIYKDKSFENTQQVLDYAKTIGDYSPSVRLWFHDDVFGALDWTHEPEVGLDELYRDRAKQLREEYDYLILLFSGGSDSSQVLKAFTKNNIHLDEVRSFYPVKLSDRMKHVWDPAHPFGLLFEYRGTALPQLQELAVTHPKTKINIVDITDDMIDVTDDTYVEKNFETFIFTDSWAHISRGVAQNNSLNNDVGDTIKGRVGVIYGADKPKLRIINNNLSFYFNSFGRSAVLYPNPKAQFITELFFWSRAAPLIPIKQSHIILKLLKYKPQFLQHFNSIQSRSTFLETNLIKRLIYPDYISDLYYRNKFPINIPMDTLLGTYYEDALKERSLLVKQTYKQMEVQPVNFAHSRTYTVGRV